MALPLNFIENPKGSYSGIIMPLWLRLFMKSDISYLFNKYKIYSGQLRFKFLICAKFSMAMKADTVFELITEKSLDIAVANPDGLERMDRLINEKIKKEPIEDGKSVIEAVNFDVNRAIRQNTNVFDIRSTYLDTILKLKLKDEDISDINRTIKGSLLESHLDLVSHNASDLVDDKYAMPVRKFSNSLGFCDSLDVAYIILNTLNGGYQLPESNGYKAPVVRFNQPNIKFGRMIVDKLYDSLSGIK